VIANHETFSEAVLALTKDINRENIVYWKKTTQVENWLDEQSALVTIDKQMIVNVIGTPWFNSLLHQLNKANTWDQLVNKLPEYDQIADIMADAVKFFPTFIEKFYFSFYLLKLPGMKNLHERLIWGLNKMVQHTMDEVPQDQLRHFIDQLFSFAAGLKQTHASSVLDIFLTVGKKTIDIDKSTQLQISRYFEEKLISFGFETPGIVYVNEDWQLSVNENHRKNISVWLELIEYSQMEMEKLLSTLIVNLKLGGIFLSDTDLFQREITKILNSNIAPFYKKVKQLTRIFPVYFNEIGAEGEIRKVTTTMDEISHRKDQLVHFLRKQVHTESNNTLIGLTRRIFIFWYDGNLEALREVLPKNVYQGIDKENEYFAPIHHMVEEMCIISGKSPSDLLAVGEKRFEELLDQLTESNPRDAERLKDTRRLYAFLKEKYSFETVDIISLLKHYSYIQDTDIEKFSKALESDDFETSLKFIYSFMTRLKQIIFNPKPSQGWENIYHKRHIAIGIPSMYGTYREPKFEALGLTFRLENVATRLMEKVVAQINLNYISGKTLKNIYTILDYFREGLELDGINNQSFNSNLRMLKYSLRSQSFSFEQYINIFQFLAEDVKRTIIKYFLKSYEIPLRIVAQQLFDGKRGISEADLVKLVNKKSEQFYREVIVDAFLMQPLDNFISRILESLREMSDNLPGQMITEIMSYNSDLVIARLGKPNPQVDNQAFLGSKAYHLKNLRMAGFPIPPGFVITTEAFRRYKAIIGHPELQKEMYDLIREHLQLVERVCKKQFGNPQNPLLLSVRSGTAISMPGAMDTFLNVGMNDEITQRLSESPGFEWSAWDSYRRLLQSWGMAYGLTRDDFDKIIENYKVKYQVEQKIDLSPTAMREVAMAYKEALVKNNLHFEENIFDQLLTTINLVFVSWSSERAKVYREHLEIADDWGTAVVVQQMIFGNLSANSGTGVVFTQDPTKEKHGVSLYGDFTLSGQGEDIVAGLVTPRPVSKNQPSAGQNPGRSLQETFPAIYKRLNQMAIDLTENHGYSPQEIEFTFESEKAEDLYILQIRDQDMASNRAADVFETPIDQMKLAGRGIGVGGGAMSGRLAFDDKEIQHLRVKFPGSHVILVRPDTVPDDIGMIFATDGLLTGKGGATSHAAVTAVRLGKTAVVNCANLQVHDLEKNCELNGHVFHSGDFISIDGYLGNVYDGNYPVKSSPDYLEFHL
jgi:pyruvate,orthophosphate dikinase